MAPKKKPKYRLEPLLVVKEKHKKQMQADLAKAIKNVAEQKERLKELEQERDAIIEGKRNARLKMGQQMVQGSKIYDSNLHLNYLEKLQEDQQAKELEVEDQKQRIIDAEEAVKRARKDFIDATKDLQAMEKHKELWMKKIKKEMMMKEEKEIGELGGAMHQLKKMNS